MVEKSEIPVIKDTMRKM